MHGARLSTRRTAVIALLAAAAAVGTAPAAAAAPGDWTQLSQTSSATRYPEVSNIAEPTMAWFGGALQVLWTQRVASGTDSYVTATLNGAGGVTTPAAVALTDWDALTKNPTLLSVGGQRFLSFSGLNPGRTGAQYFATSADGSTWNLSTGSLSETQSAYAAYGSDTVDNAGTPVWVGNAGTTTGIRWHVGTSASNPAPAGSDQQLLLAGCCAYSAAAARDEVTGVVYAAFYSNSRATTENGIQVGQILPALGAFAQAPGSTQDNNGAAASLDPDQQVAMAARAGGGVFVAYKVGYPTARVIRVLRVDNGAALDIPVKGNVRSVSMGADPQGRIWVAWNQDNRMRAVHTNQAGTVLGAVGQWQAPRGTSTMWKTTTVGSAGGADVVVTATTRSAINVWHTQINRTLTVKASPSTPRRNSSVRFTVTDAGDPVAGATVRFAGSSGRTNGAGAVTLGASRAGTATATKRGFNPGSTSVRVR